MEKQRRTDTVRPCVEVEREEVTMYSLSRGEPDTTTALIICKQNQEMCK